MISVAVVECGGAAGEKTTPMTLAIKHGINMEAHAKRAYVQVMRRKHRNFTVGDSGFHINRAYPFTGASPDLLVTCGECKSEDCGHEFCGCCGAGDDLCEIKCLHSIASAAPSADNYCYLRINDAGETKLKTNSQYFYYQIMCQLAATKRSYCDFLCTPIMDTI